MYIAEDERCGGRFEVKDGSGNEPAAIATV
jgi:hypothetical protein